MLLTPVHGQIQDMGVIHVKSVPLSQHNGFKKMNSNCFYLLSLLSIIHCYISKCTENIFGKLKAFWWKIYGRYQLFRCHGITFWGKIFKNSLLVSEFKHIIQLDGKVEWCIMVLVSIHSKATIIIFRHDLCL